MAYTILFRRGTTIQWETADPTLREGELGYATDVKLFKIGDGINKWTDLPYRFATLGSDGRLSTDQIPLDLQTEIYEVLTIAERNTLSPRTGDIVIVEENSTTYIYKVDQWVELKAPIPDIANYPTFSDLSNTIAGLNLGDYSTTLQTLGLIESAIDEIGVENFITSASLSYILDELNLPPADLLEIDRQDRSIIVALDSPDFSSPNIPYNYSNSVGLGHLVFTSASAILDSSPNAKSVFDSIAIGVDTVSNANQSSENVAVGYRALRGGGFKNIAIGNYSMEDIVADPTDTRGNPTSAQRNTGLGHRSLNRIQTGSFNVGIGSHALEKNESGSFNIGIGANALRTYDNEVDFTGNNAIAIGASATVPGDNIIKLGNYSQETMTYGSVLNSADSRDVVDVRNTELGLDFINELRPVDFKWNYREQYPGFVSGTGQEGTEYHHGLIAQEVMSAASGLSVAFGGVKDFSISGNVDIKAIGYQEFIPPIIKSIQELDDKVDANTDGLSEIAILSASVASFSAAYAQLLQGDVFYETFSFLSDGTAFYVTASPGYVHPDRDAISASPNTAFTFDIERNPTVNLTRGRNYRFDLVYITPAYPFALRDGSESVNEILGTTNNDPVNGRAGDSLSPFIFYSVPLATNYTSIIYQSPENLNIQGVINLIDP